MNEEGIFNARYEKALELAAKVGPGVVEKIEKFVSSLPKALRRNISREKSCELTSTDISIDLDMHDNMMEIRRLNYINSVDTYVYIYPFYISELKELSDNYSVDSDAHNMLIASITYTNSKNGASIQLFYTEENGEYKFDGVKIPNNAKEFDFSVYLDIVDNEYVLSCIMSFNDLELKEIKQTISYDELIYYSCDAVEESLDDNCEDEDSY